MDSSFGVEHQKLSCSTYLCSTPIPDIIWRTLPETISGPPELRSVGSQPRRHRVPRVDTLCTASLRPSAAAYRRPHPRSEHWRLHKKVARERYHRFGWCSYLLPRVRGASRPPCYRSRPPPTAGGGVASATAPGGPVHVAGARSDACTTRSEATAQVRPAASIHYQTPILCSYHVP